MTTDEKRKILEDNGYEFRYVEYFPIRQPEVWVRVGEWHHICYYDDVIDTGQSEDEIIDYLANKAWQHYQATLSD